MTNKRVSKKRVSNQHETKKPWLVLLLISLLIGACSSQAQAGAIGNAENGKALFQQTSIREAPACSTCHSIEPGETVVGPSLAGVASRAGERKAGLSVEAYLRESIVEPDAYIVEGFTGGVMYPHFQDVLTEEEIDDLVAYLLELR